MCQAVLQNTIRTNTWQNCIILTENRTMQRNKGGRKKCATQHNMSTEFSNSMMHHLIYLWEKYCYVCNIKTAAMWDKTNAFWKYFISEKRKKNLVYKTLNLNFHISELIKNYIQEQIWGKDGRSLWHAVICAFDNLYSNVRRNKNSEKVGSWLMFGWNEKDKMKKVVGQTSFQ